MSLEEDINRFLSDLPDRYSEEMSNLETWGGDIELDVIAMIFKVKIIVHNHTNLIPIGDGNKEIHIQYNGNNHYKAISADGEIIEVAIEGDCLFESCIKSAISNGVDLLQYGTVGLLRKCCLDYKIATDNIINNYINLM